MLFCKFELNKKFRQHVAECYKVLLWKPNIGADLFKRDVSSSEIMGENWIFAISRLWHTEEICGLILKICEFAICGLAYLRICGFAIEEWSKTFPILSFADQ